MATRFPVSSVVNDVVSLRQVMDRALSESFAPGRTRTVWSSSKSSRSQAPVTLDVYATDDEAIVLAAVPGVDPANIDISIEKNTLTLKGEYANNSGSDQARSATWYLHELPWGTFQRSLTLPWDIDVDAADATFEHGLLRLTLPKSQAAKPKQIRVRVESNQPSAIEHESTPELTEA
ncbi:MAG: Hsp20/alpha crystallin family protein [Thermomicrobiales bacterium]